MARVLFVCKQNAGRSQMSEALFLQAANGRHQAHSAGTAPAQQVDPTVVGAMRELGIDLAGRKPQKLTNHMAQWADVVVTMGCGDECPFIPGKGYRLGANRPRGPAAQRSPSHSGRDPFPR